MKGKKMRFGVRKQNPAWSKLIPWRKHFEILSKNSCWDKVTKLEISIIVRLALKARSNDDLIKYILELSSQTHSISNPLFIKELRCSFVVAFRPIDAGLIYYTQYFFDFLYFRCRWYRYSLAYWTLGLNMKILRFDPDMISQTTYSKITHLDLKGMLKI